MCRAPPPHSTPLLGSLPLLSSLPPLTPSSEMLLRLPSRRGTLPCPSRGSAAQCLVDCLQKCQLSKTFPSIKDVKTNEKNSTHSKSRKLSLCREWLLLSSILLCVWDRERTAKYVLLSLHCVRCCTWLLLSWSAYDIPLRAASWGDDSPMMLG
jgi:hypothetical protein